jgi:hypothetical protein
MAGGIDLVKLLRSKEYGVRPNIVEKKRKEVSKKRKERLAVEKELQILAHKEDGLVALRKEREEKEREGARLSLYEKALRRVELLEQQENVRKRLKAFPEATAFLKGDELERLARIERDLEMHQKRCDEAEVALGDAQRKMEENKVSERALEEGVLPRLRGRASHVLELEKELRDKQQELFARAKAFEALVRAWGGDPKELQALCSRILGVLEGKLERLESLLAAYQANCGEDEEIGARKRWLEQKKKKLLEQGEELPREEWIRRGLAELERILTWSRLNTWTLLLVLGIEIVALSFWPLWVGVTVAFFLVLGFAVERAFALKRFRRGSFGGSLPENPLEAFFQLQKEMQRKERWEEVEEDLEELALREDALGEKEAQLGAEMGALREAIGLDPGVGSLSLVDWARRMVELREAQEALLLAQGRVEECLAGFKKERGELVAQLGLLKGERLPEELGGAECSELVVRFGETCAELKQARGDAKQAETRLEDAMAGCERALVDRRELYKGVHLSLDDRGALVEAAKSLELFRRERKALDRMEAELEGLDEALEGEPTLRTQDAELAARWGEIAREAQKKAGDLREKIGEVQGEIERTKRSNDLAQALDAWKLAKEDWVQVGEEEVKKSLARGLLRSVLVECAAQVETPVFEKAKELFAGFTRGRFELRLKPDDGGNEGDRFFAFDRERGVSLSLSELSDGTRSQLLLAARIAFATVEERGVSLPIFLDEALSHADDSRHQAIVDSLLALVQEGRQVILLTADEADVSRIEAQVRESGEEQTLQVIRLPEHLGVPSEGEPAYRLPSRPQIPSPKGMSPSAYAAALRVPAANLFETAGSLHLFFLLWDNLDLLHTLLLQGYSTVAQITSPQKPKLKGDTHVLELRCGLWLRFRALWDRNRPRPLTRQALRESSLGSSTFLPKVLDRIPESGILFSEIPFEEFSGLRRKTKDELKSWAEDQGYSYADPPLSDEEILQDVICGSPLPLEETNALVHMFLAGFKEPLEQNGQG